MLYQRIHSLTRSPPPHLFYLFLITGSHFDFFPEVEDGVNDANHRRQPNRLATVLIYLTDVLEGGETLFPFAPAVDDGGEDDVED